MLEYLLQWYSNGKNKYDSKIRIDDVAYFWRHPSCVKIKIIK